MGKEARLSNIELLRIIAMIMIVFHHYATHGGVYWNVYDGANEWISTIMISFGKISVDIFMIICGYFMVEQNITWKKLLKLEIPVWFYSVLFGLIACFGTVYLIHDNLYVRNHLWGQWLRCGDYYWSDKLWLHGICCVAIVFVECVIIEWVRSLIFDRILVKAFIQK